MEKNIALVGCGHVGSNFLKLLNGKKQLLEEAYGIKFKVVAIIDIYKGSIFQPNGINLKEVINCLETDKDLKKLSNISFKTPTEIRTFIEAEQFDILAEASWTDLKTGEPATGYIKKALQTKKHVITTNKGPIALHYEELKEIAEKNNLHFKFEGVVLAGTPLFNLVEGPLAGSKILRIRGIVNGTTNFILTEMEKGKSYDEALKEAQKRGYAEADPSMDVEGKDAAGKLAIMTKIILNEKVNINDIECEGITKITQEDIQNALKNNKKIKLIAKAELKGKKLSLSVKPELIPLSDPLAGVNGPINAVSFDTDTLGTVTITGPGAGPKEAGYALFTDFISICRKH